MRTILNTRFSHAGRELRLQAPFAQPAHLGLSKSFDFEGYDRTKLSGCLSPFINIPPGARSPEARARMDEELRAMENYDTMTGLEGVGTVTLADAKEITKGKPFVSSMWVENEIQYECHIVQVATFLGCDHDVTKELIKAYGIYSRNKLLFQSAMEEIYGPLLGPPMWLYHCHVHTISWLDAQIDSQETESLPTTGIMDALDQYNRGSNLSFMP